MESKNNPTNPYEILGVGTYSPLRKVKEAYRILSLKFHPDINGDTNENREEFRRITEAYSFIKRDIKKIHDILGVSQFAEIDEVDAAYKRKIDDLIFRSKEKDLSNEIDELKKYYKILKSSFTQNEGEGNW